ncbi:prepilin peptidase [Gammaproteobacteria bacterium]|nr:prepilin peptidase [Gammaproteobacteria bacterium]
MITLFSLLFGLIIGSFLNVVIHRLPVMIRIEWQKESFSLASDFLDNPEEKRLLKNKMVPGESAYNLAFPASQCPSCGTKIKYKHNIPLIGFFLLRARCSSCSMRISPRYPLVEFLSAILTFLCINEFGWTLHGASAALLSYVLISLACIDYESGLLPDSITIPFLWVGLILNYFDTITSFEKAFWGALLGYLVLWTVYQAFKLFTKKEGMGFGDFKMLAMLGAWLGAVSIPAIIMLSSISCLILVSFLSLKGRDLTQPVRFGPFLAFAGFAVIFWGDELNNLYLNGVIF